MYDTMSDSVALFVGVPTSLHLCVTLPGVVVVLFGSVCMSVCTPLRSGISHLVV